MSFVRFSVSKGRLIDCSSQRVWNLIPSNDYKDFSKVSEFDHFSSEFCHLNQNTGTTWAHNHRARFSSDVSYIDVGDINPGVEEQVVDKQQQMTINQEIKAKDDNSFRSRNEVKTFRELSEKCEKTKDWEPLASALLNFQPPIHRNYVNKAVSGLCKTGKASVAEKLLNKLKKTKNYSVDGFALATMMVAFTDSGNLRLANRYVYALLKLGEKPNVVAYSSLIEAYGKRKQWKQAYNIAQVMMERGYNAQRVYIFKSTEGFGECAARRAG